MERADLRHAVLASVVLGLIGATVFVMAIRWGMPSALTGPPGYLGRSRAWFADTGIHAAESRGDQTSPVRWTGPTSRIVLRNLDRSQEYFFSLRLAAPERPPDQGASVRVFVDGAVVVSGSILDVPHRIVISIPRRATSAGLHVVLETSPALVASSTDKRQRGVLIEDIALRPATGHFRAKTSVMLNMALALALVAAAYALVGLRGWRHVAVAACAAGVLVWFGMQDGAFIGVYASRVLWISAGLLGVSGAAYLIRARWLNVASPGLTTALALTLTAVTIELVLVNSPLFPVGDGIFHVHRAELVRAGSFFFTSITPRPYYEFPYAPGFYVVASPLWRFFASELDHLRLLRGLVIGAHALVGLALYALARKQWQDRRTALFCVGLWMFAREPLQALVTANLTNAFSESVFALAMLGTATLAIARRFSAAAVVAVGGLVTLAILSHFSTLSVGVPLASAIGLMLWSSPQPIAQRVGKATLLVTLASVSIAYVVYYSHFTSLYQQTLARLLSGEGQVAANPLAAPPSVKLAAVMRGVLHMDPWRVLLVGLEAIGAWALLVQRRREPLTRVLIGWGVIWAAFSILGIATPIQMRSALSAAPLWVALRAYGLGTIASRSPAAAVASLGIIAFDGARAWFVTVV